MRIRLFYRSLGGIFDSGLGTIKIKELQKATRNSGLFILPKWRQSGDSIFLSGSALLVMGSDTVFLYDAALPDGALHAAPFPGHVSVCCQAE
ncbi:hypothetical protein [Aeromonas veronii]|uniref:hypothetical protein n=1 Tax=Aeromonas veronii TaxID=654 RepID=UPI0022480187|nr:hypothetical protein [Aeromonas veronii]MCX0435725.1 hypothetical protein [Aeromonas veronii]